MARRHTEGFYFPQTMVLLLIVFFIFLISLSQQKPGYLTAVGENIPVNYAPETMPATSPEPTRPPGPAAVAQSIEPQLTARAVVVLDRASGTVLYEKNEDLPLWPASTTKIMTALVTLDAYGLSDIVTIQNPVHEGRIMNLQTGERITVESLLYGILIHSANDAAYALADHHPEGQEGFISDMNKKANELHLVNTHFVDPAGFDNNKQYSTASDLAALSLAALDYSLIARIVSIPTITISDADYTIFHRLTNVNELLGRVPGVAGVKTGWTENAKENLINLTRRNGNEILTVVLGSDDRFGETQILTDWIFARYLWSNQDAVNSLSTPDQ